MNFSSHQTEAMVCVQSTESHFGAEGDLWGPSCSAGACWLQNHPPGPPSLLERIVSARQQIPSAPPLPHEGFGLLGASGCVKRPQLTSQQQAKAQRSSGTQGHFTSSLLSQIIFPEVNGEASPDRAVVIAKVSLQSLFKGDTTIHRCVGKPRQGSGYFGRRSNGPCLAQHP